MTLSPEAATAQAQILLGFKQAEKERLERLHLYLLGRQPLVVAPAASPREVTRLARMSRVNILAIVVSCVAQAMYVDGYRQGRDAEDAPAWDVWQANAMDAYQTAVHRAALTYGTSYATVLPGEPMPVIKGFSPLRMTTLYGDDPFWPVWALQSDPGNKYRLYDAESVYFFSGDPDSLTFVDSKDHGVGNVPVVRFLNQMDLDEDNVGEVEPLIELQDQIDLTTFSLLVAQHYGAFKQKAIIGWLAESEVELAKAGASLIQTFEDPDVKLHQWEETELKGYLESREASLRHAATISQTPVHELIGSMINLSAEALVAAEAGQRRKIVERQMSFGESWEQVLALAGKIAHFEAADDAQVRWRDTESRALAATVDALGKMAQMLGIPPQELWDRVPGATQQDIERWKAAFVQGDALANLTALLDRQGAANTPPVTAVA